MTPSVGSGRAGKGFVDVQAAAVFSHRVVLLDGVDVQPLELHHRLHVALERVQLPQPRDLSSSLGLLRDLRQLAVAALVVEQRVGGGLRRLQTVEGPLGGGPLRLPLFPAVILLGGEGSLHTRNSEIHKQTCFRKYKSYVCLPKTMTEEALQYLVLKEVVPGPATEHEADEELEQVQWEVEHDAVQPDDAGPAPADTLNPGKAPVGVHSKEGSNLYRQNRQHIRLVLMCQVSVESKGKSRHLRVEQAGKQ